MFEPRFAVCGAILVHWTAFEGFINHQLPSPECYASKIALGNPDSSQRLNEEQKDDQLGEQDSQEKEPEREHDDDEDNEERPIINDLFDDGQDGTDSNDLPDEEQEIRVSMNGNGELVPLGSQLADYQRRGSELNDVCVWDFVSRVDKVSKASDRRNHHGDGDDEHDQEQNAIELNTILDEAAQDCEPEENEPDMPVLEILGRKRPRVQLQKGHEEEKTHLLRVRAPKDQLVPVPIGPVNKLKSSQNHPLHQKMI
ncbi:hypothetical protein B0H13DRAFT_1908154 [Mycena leptocephala]|nr:hypothetical protein B0H13DRAFT_1908154 [Mycena leptocephala]